LRKITAIIISLLLSTALLFVLLAPRASAEDQERAQNKIHVEENNTEEVENGTEEGQELLILDNQGVPGEGIKNRLTNSIQHLEKVMTRFKDPEDGNQVREMVQEQNQVQERVQVALSSMDARPGFLRFILGPDYKNAGQVRSQIVQLRNQIEQLTRLKEKLTLQQDQESVQTAIDSLQAEANALEGELNQKLEGFTLFGWLAKLLAQY
jgi:hypothetical protein